MRAYRGSSTSRRGRNRERERERKKERDAHTQRQRQRYRERGRVETASEGQGAGETEETTRATKREHITTAIESGGRAPPLQLKHGTPSESTWSVRSHVCVSAWRLLSLSLSLSPFSLSFSLAPALGVKYSAVFSHWPLEVVCRDRAHAAQRSMGNKSTSTRSFVFFLRSSLLGA